MDRPLSEECARGGADALRIFHDAFVTELGSELAEGRRLASLRELLDVIICAGKDCLIQDLLRLWPYATDKDEIFTFDECFQIYQSLPSTSVEELYDVFDAFSVEKCQCEDDGGGGEYGGVELDYGTLMEQLATEGRGDVVKWLRRHLHRQTDIENLVYEVIEYRKRLRSLNSQIVEENGFLARTLLKSSDDHPSPPPPLVRANSLDERGERVVAGGEHKVSNVSSGSRHFHHSRLHFMMARSESAESLSSLFSNRNSRTTTLLQGGGDDGVGMSTAGGQMPPQGHRDRGGAGGRGTADHQTSEERIQLKSMVIQRELSETSCIAYAFSLDKPRKMRLSVCVNEGNVPDFGWSCSARRGLPLLMEPFRVDRFHADELDPLLAEHFWEQGKSLPYLREMQTLRQFKSDYYAVLLAGRTQSQTHYMLDMSSSNNVNIEGSELMVNQFVPANTLRILSVAIAQAESWFLSVKLAGYKLQSGRE
uniref:TLDc domain-containing protein n=1 Tax=Globodera pallida TaxID=36090 RepID=A0A183C5L6_GLOPA